MANIQIYPDAVSLAEAVAQRFVDLARDSILKKGQFTVALAGGSTPEAAYHLLSTEPYASQIDWSRVHIFWGDERCVSPDDPQSNYRMTRQALLEVVPIPQENIHRMDGEMEPEESALIYEHQLRNHFWDLSNFNLVLLGMGTDGHTASLFPDTEAIHEDQRWVVAHFVPKLETWRLTLTPAIINSADQIIFVVSGENKAQPLRDVLHGSYKPHSLPSQIIKPVRGKLTWMVDTEAARLLE